MEKIVAQLAGIGVPILVLMAEISASGYAGAAAITVALSVIGPGGMIGGIVTLCISGIVMQAITEYGLDAVFEAVLKKLMDDGESKESIKRIIESYPISNSLKYRLYEMVDKY